MTPDDRPTLYSFRRCPYAMRARMAIAASGQACGLREVVLRDKPAAMLEASPKGTVPVLVLSDGTVVDESIDVMQWALGRNDPENWMDPQVGTRDDMLALITENDSDFKHHLDRYKYPNRYNDVDPLVHRAGGYDFLKKLEARLSQHRYLFGNRISLADVAIMPFVRQFANHDRGWFDALEMTGLHRWLEDLLASDLFTSVMAKYDQWQPGDPEVDFPPSA